MSIFSWFHIAFVENEGAAWGLKLPGASGKLILSLFRVVAVSMIGYWLYNLIKNRKSKLFIFATSLIFAGAVGNILDSIFYGIIFNESLYQVATIFPEESYGSILQGRVVDMLSFPLIDTTWPNWIPFLGGSPFQFFKYVFNIADTSITIGGVFLFFAFRGERQRK